MADLEVWMMTELDVVANKMRQHSSATESTITE
jgi:hypothetical protein